MKRKILYHFVHIALFTRNIFRWRYFCILNIATFCTWKQRNKWHDEKKHIQNKHMNEGRRNIVYDLKIRWKCNKPKKEYCGTNRSINQSIWGHTISGTEYTVWVWMCLFSFIPLNYQFYHLIIFLFSFCFH